MERKRGEGKRQEGVANLRGRSLEEGLCTRSVARACKGPEEVAEALRGHLLKDLERTLLCHLKQDRVCVPQLCHGMEGSREAPG